jgi:hypothetical protein
LNINLCLSFECIVANGNPFLQHTFAGMYLTLHDLWKQAVGRCNPLSSKSWNYHVFHYTDGLVGLLSASLSNGCWILSDATKSIPCVLSGNMEDLVKCHGAIVLLLRCTVVTEVFEVRDAHMWAVLSGSSHVSTKSWCSTCEGLLNV